MRVGFNARRLAGQRLGIGRYIEYLLKNWDPMLRPSDRVNLYVPEMVALNGLRLSEAFSIKLLQPKLKGVVWENLVLPRCRPDVDVLFGPSYTLPLTYRGKCVVATHSINEVQRGAHPWWYRVSYTPWYKWSAQRADRVIVPSQSTRTDVHTYYGIPLDKIDVVQEGVDDAFQPIEDAALRRRTRERYLGTDTPCILFVGKMSQRRNIPNLIAAFSILKHRYRIPHRLLLMGPNHLHLPLGDLIRKYKVADSVVQTDGRVSSHQELVAIYNAADLYVYPSAYDGFSLTVVEAMACGVPVVTVNRAALREIAGGCALMVEEPTVDALAEAMQQTLHDQALRESMRTRGLERAQSLRWSETARGTLEVLRRVVSN